MSDPYRTSPGGGATVSGAGTGSSGRSGNDESSARLGAGAEASQRAAGKVSESAKETAGSLRGEAEGRVESGKEQIADRLSRAAHNVQRSAEELRGEEQWLADFMDRGSRELDNLAQSLKNRDLGSLVGTLEGFARRQPAAFVGASVALGFAIGRVVRNVSPSPSSSSRFRSGGDDDLGAYGGGLGRDRGVDRIGDDLEPPRSTRPLADEPSSGVTTVSPSGSATPELPRATPQPLGGPSAGPSAGPSHGPLAGEIRR